MSTIPPPSVADLERHADEDYKRLSGYGPTSPQGRIAQWWASWIRRAVAAERERDELQGLAERLETENSELKAELVRREANGNLIERIAELEPNLIQSQRFG